MAARGYSRLDKGFILLGGIAAVAGLWMVAAALGGDEGLLRVLSSPRTMTETPKPDSAVVRQHTRTDAPTIAPPRPSAADRVLSAPLPARTATASTPANQSIAESDPRQQLLSTAVAARRSKPLPKVPWTPAVSSPPLRPGDQT